MTILSNLLNIDQSPAELNDIYGARDYYWYLRSIPFQETFLKPLASLVNAIKRPCLDVGCGEGQLSEFVNVPYVGIDGSANAIAKAESRFQGQPHKSFLVRRFESGPPPGVFPTVIFGGVLSVLIKPEGRVKFLESFLSCGMTSLLIYDLSILDTSAIDKRFTKQVLIENVAEIDGIEDVKKKRQIVYYQVEV
jgi:SAM-dependent methyltransferase